MDAVVLPFLSPTTRFHLRTFPLTIDSEIWEEHGRALSGSSHRPESWPRSAAVERRARRARKIGRRGREDDALRGKTAEQPGLVADHLAFRPSYHPILDEGSDRGVAVPSPQNILRKSPSVGWLVHFLLRVGLRWLGERIHGEPARSAQKSRRVEGAFVDAIPGQSGEERLRSSRRGGYSND
jgi:hypothetical protein